MNRCDYFEHYTDLKPPTYSIAACIPGLSKTCTDAESYITAWVNKNKSNKNYQLVIDNFDFYSGFVALILVGEPKPYKTALEVWTSRK